MARKEFMGEDGDFFVLNETIIGKGGDNRKFSDVQLIQFFLRQFFIPRPQLFAKLPKPRRTATPVLTIDGKFGPQTATGIVEFQKFVRDAGQGTIKVDGLVNVATGFRSSISKTIYTIMHLNLFFFNDNNNGDPNFSKKIENHPDIIAFAPELRAELIAAKVGDQF